MKRLFLFFSALSFAGLAAAVPVERGAADLATFQPAPPAEPKPSLLIEFNVGSYGAFSDGAHDETEAFQRCFNEAAAAHGGLIRIPPRTYYLSGKSSIRIPSRTKVVATGAKFVLPPKLGDRARIVLFEGTDVEDFVWEGGEFQGRVFDPAATQNAWEPNVQTIVFMVKTSAEGTTARLAFKDIKADSIAGAVVAVKGIPEPDDEREAMRLASDISVENCQFLRCGRVMWDYGYLWQVTTWPNEYNSVARDLAARYFPSELVTSGEFEAGGRRFHFQRTKDPLQAARDRSPAGMVTFFGDELPTSIVRGKAYFVLAATDSSIEIADSPGGHPITFGGTTSIHANMIRNISKAYWELFEPSGSGEIKGAIELTECERVKVENCAFSALGDATHFRRVHDGHFVRNRITGARMGAFYLGDFCRNNLVEENHVEGTNGSRGLSVERGSQRTVIRNNEFIGAGRGAWINQPENILIERNTFTNNTTKGEKNFKHGRRTYATGDFEAHSEVYFTLYQPAGHYSGVIVRNNRFETGPEAIRALAFQRNGSDIEVTGNTFTGPVRSVEINVTCTNVKMANNRGATRVDQK